MDLSATLPFRFPPLASYELHLLGYDIPLLLTLTVIFIITRVVKLYNGIRAVGYLPGFRLPFEPLGNLTAVIPTYWWNLGIDANWRWRDTFHTRFNSECISVVPFLYGKPTIYVANYDVAQQVATKPAFAKSLSAGKAISKWGENLVGIVDMRVWRNHRRIIAPAFSSKLYKKVWTESLNVYRQMETDEGWVNKDVAHIPAMQNISVKFALLVIASCGFGFPTSWSNPPQGPDGQMSLQESLSVLEENHLVAFILPDFVRFLPYPGFGKIREAYNTFHGFMRNEIASRAAEVHNDKDNVDGRTDAFSMLVRANEQESSKLKLSDRELFGNVFILLIAGHETSAHTLSATIALLALHPAVQNELLEQIVSVVGYDRDPEFSDFNKLHKVLAAFHEGLRMFPTVYIMMRETAEDTVLDIPNPVGQDGTTAVPIARGTKILTNMVGIQHNPRYFENPKEFRPSRWYEGNKTDQTAAFGFGPRVCIGKKFVSIEATLFLTVLIRDWEIKPKLLAGETVEEWRKRVEDSLRMMMTLSLTDVPIILVRRKETY